MKLAEKIKSFLYKVKLSLLYPKLYWVRTIVWEFWAWKTFNTFLNALNYKKNRNSFIISNIPYTYNNITYSSKNDLLKIYKFLLLYAVYLSTPLDTENWEKDYKILKQNYKFKSIILITDEVWAYFNPVATWKEWKIPTDVLTVLKQARKINLLIYNIDQILSKINKDFRANTPDVISYYKGLGFIQWFKVFYLKTNDSTDLKSDEVAEEKWSFIFNLYLNPRIKKFLNRNKYLDKYFYSQDYLSYYTTWFWDELHNLDFFTFLDDIYKETGWFMKTFEITEKEHKEIMDKLKLKLNIEKDFKNINIEYNGQYYNS